MRRKIVLLNKLSYMQYCNFVTDLFWTRCVQGLCILPDEKHRPFFLFPEVTTASHGTRLEGSTSKFHRWITYFSRNYARFQKGLWIDFHNAWWSFSGLLSHIIREVWKYKRRLLFWLIYFIWTQMWLILREKSTSLLTGYLEMMWFQKELISSLSSSWKGTFHSFLCGQPDPGNE